MLRVDEYLEQASSLSKEEFVSRRPGFFLLKRPKKNVSLQPGPPSFGFATVTVKTDFDPFAGEWRIAPVVKRPDNPFPERISVGRATNCDIVLRLPFISKVHAHILLEPGNKFSLRDNQPSNPTFLNHRKLEPGSTRSLSVGDMVGFGSLDFEFVDSARLYDVLRRGLL
ncbi:MAG TPA: FHA domain-containing protein [Polyangiaceae bacterium]|nr:FHA domain-containing protein [Polyangiaceae bacterium]